MLKLDDTCSPKIWIANADPLIRVCDDFVSEEEAAVIIQEFESQLQRSNVMKSDGGSEPGPARTSFTSYLPAGDPNSESNALRVIDAIENRASMLLGIPVSQIETLQLLRYREGQKYEPHHDYFKNDEKNNRTATALVYLNDLPENSGGETRFPELNLSIKPVRGRAVMWSNCVVRGENVVCDSRTLHGGDPPRSETTKYALNIWARGLPIR